jgi:hypothetical protein
MIGCYKTFQGNFMLGVSYDLYHLVLKSVVMAYDPRIGYFKSSSIVGLASGLKPRS